MEMMNTCIQITNCQSAAIRTHLARLTSLDITAMFNVGDRVRAAPLNGRELQNFNQKLAYKNTFVLINLSQDDLTSHQALTA